jgi:hypothetical protein
MQYRIPWVFVGACDDAKTRQLSVTLATCAGSAKKYFTWGRIELKVKLL